MANNGNHSDTKLFKKYLKNKKQIPFLKSDGDVDIILKIKMNELISYYSYEQVLFGFDELMVKRFNNIHIKLNGIRQKHWYFNKLKV